MEYPCLLLVVSVATLCLGTMAQSWPYMSSPKYPCCCPLNPKCGGCFTCRNFDYTCNCDRCSCYDEDEFKIRKEKQANEEEALLQMILQNVYGSYRKKRDITNAITEEKH